MLLLFSGVPSLELPEVKQMVPSARSRTVRAALFSGVALRDLRAARESAFTIESQTDRLKEVAARWRTGFAADVATVAFTSLVRGRC
jgi:hypothetical protein